MTVKRAHKIRIKDLTQEQITHLNKSCGTSRFTYNHVLGNWIDRYKHVREVKALLDARKIKCKTKEDSIAKKKTIKDAESALRGWMINNKIFFNEMQERKDLNAIKAIEYPWMYEVSKCCVQLAIKDSLNSSFINFIKHGKGFPQFKKKYDNDSFKLSNDHFTLDGATLKIPKGHTLKLTESLRYGNAKILSATISRTADWWYVSIQVQVELPDVAGRKPSPAIGVDLGVSTFAKLSNGDEVKGSDKFKRYEKKLRRLDQSLSRKRDPEKSNKEQSKNYKKVQVERARLYAKIKNARDDTTHKLTSKLVKSYDVIGIEDLNVSGMMKNRKLSKAIQDKSFFEFKRQLEYKSVLSGSQIVEISQWFPSSKSCSACGLIFEGLTLAMREWACEGCGACHDRDLNAAINIERYAIEQLKSA